MAPWKQNLTWMHRLTLAADTGTATGEPAADPAGGEGAEAGGEGGADTAGPQRPEWFPERLWDDGSTFQTKDGQLDYDALGTALKQDRDHNKGKVFKRKDDLAREVREEIQNEQLQDRPESPDSYELRVPEGLLPEGMELSLNEDELAQEFKQTAHDLGLSQEQMDGLVGIYARAQLQNLPDIDQEMEKLGEQAPQRLERVERFMEQHLSDDARATIANQFVSASMVQVLEEMMELSGEPRFISTESGGYQEDVTVDDLRKLQQSEDYRKGDPATVKKVREGFRKLTTKRAQGR